MVVALCVLSWLATTSSAWGVSAGVTPCVGVCIFWQLLGARFGQEIGWSCFPGEGDLELRLQWMDERRASSEVWTSRRDVEAARGANLVGNNGML